MIPGLSQNDLIYFEHIARYLFAKQFVKGKRVLDVACGSGYGAYELLKGGASAVIGLDNSRQAISYARKKYKKKGISFLRGDAEEMPFMKGEFDIIVSFETIEHLKNQDEFVIEVKRVLKNKGLLIISTPNKLVYPKGNIFHTQELTPKNFRNLLRHHFKNLEMYYQDNISANYILSADNLSQDEKERKLTPVTLNITNRRLFKLPVRKNLYLIGVASDSQLHPITESSILFNPKNPQRVEELKLKLKTKTLELKSIKNSRGWKIISLFQILRKKIPF